MDTVLTFLDRLIGFPTVSRDGNIDLIRWVGATLGEAGIEARLFPHPSGDRASLFATVGPATGGGIVLSGHTDVVPVDGQAWTSDPFRLERRGSRFLGRGTADMKGFIACALQAMIEAAGQPLKRPLHIALSYDEEVGCIGVRPMLAELAKAGLRPDIVVIGEPTDMAVATGHKGKLAARATCRGHAAHSALAPKGLNAIHLATDFIAAIRQRQMAIEDEGLRDDDYDVPYTTVHAGIVHGGTALNIVPDMTTVDFEVRNVAADDAGAILQGLFEAARRISEPGQQRFPETGITIETTNDYPGLDTDRNNAAVSALIRVVGGRTKKVAFGTEGGLFTQSLGVPVVVCGPGSMDQGHKPDEFVEYAQLDECRAMLGRVIDGLTR